MDYKDNASTVLKDWAEQVLIDYRLTWADIFGASSDAGPDVKALFTKVLKMVGSFCHNITIPCCRTCLQAPSFIYVLHMYSHGSGVVLISSMLL